MKYLGFIFSWGLLAVFLVGLGFPIQNNIHKGMIDKPGDVWYGYELVFFGSLIVVGIPYLVGLFAILFSAVTFDISREKMVILGLIWLLICPFIIWTYMPAGQWLAGYNLLGIPLITFIFPVIMRYAKNKNRNDLAQTDSER